MLIKPLLPFFLGISNLMLGIVEVNSKLSPINLFSLTTGSGNFFIFSSLIPLHSFIFSIYFLSLSLFNNNLSPIMHYNDSVIYFLLSEDTYGTM